MIVRTLAGIEGSERDVGAPTWKSRRLVLAADGAGFSFHDTVIYAGTETTMWYRHHVEAVYCLEGVGTVHDLDHGTEHPLRPGTLYLLDGHERHRVVAETDLRLACVFTPPCTGREVHGPDGSYPLLADEGDGDGPPGAGRR